LSGAPQPEHFLSLAAGAGIAGGCAPPAAGAGGV